MLLWSIANWQIIPTRSVIGKSNNINEKECMLCEAEEATLEYIIMHCLIAKSFESTPHGPLYSLKCMLTPSLIG